MGMFIEFSYPNPLINYCSLLTAHRSYDSAPPSSQKEEETKVGHLG